MTTFLLRRLLMSLFVLLMVTLIVFLAMRLLPGDPLIIYVAQGQQLASLSDEGLQELRKEYGLDKPIPVQYVNWLFGLIRGDLGKSIFFNSTVGALLLERFPPTIFLGLISFFLSTIFGILIGLMAAVRRGQWGDRLITPLSYVGITIPQFWLGILLIYLFGLKLNWLPIIGYTSPFDDLWMSIKQAVMPVICLSLGALAATARQMRSSMLEVIRQDYIRTAWSKGLKESRIISKHALKNSLIPVVTVLGLHLRFLIGGSVIVETVFSVPGIGYLMVSSIFAQDYAVVQACTLLFASIIVLANLAVDLSYGWLDPRIKYE